jgi:S-adenosylmethionine decarboxylase
MSAHVVPPVAGQHWLVEFAHAQHLDSLERVRAALAEAAVAAGVVLLKIELHHFGLGMGVTGMALLAESHISIHTWPEHGYAAIDLFMCGVHANPEAALTVLTGHFLPGAVEVRRFTRGVS